MVIDQVRILWPCWPGFITVRVGGEEDRETSQAGVEVELSRKGGLGTQPVLYTALNASQGQYRNLTLLVQSYGRNKGQTHCTDVHEDTNQQLYLLHT